MTVKFFALFPVLALTLLLVGAACGGDDDGSGTAMDRDSSGNTSVKVNLRNWAVEPSKASISAGKVQFTAIHEMEDHGAGMTMNEGGATHELVVAIEDPTGSGSFGKVLLRIADLKPGDSMTKSVDLRSGTYELSCRIGEVVNGKPVSHYERGMRTTIRVT